jgi:hypothetical protein
MVLVVVCGFSIAALRASSALWASVTMTLAVGLFLTAVLGAAFRRGQARAFWAGFALFGWSYLIVVFGPWFRTEVAPHLVTTPILEYVEVHIKQLPPGAVPYHNSYYIGAVRTPWSYLGPRNGEEYMRTGHSLVGLLVALIGGILGRLFFYLQLRSDREAALPGQWDDPAV